MRAGAWAAAAVAAAAARRSGRHATAEAAGHTAAAAAVAPVAERRGPAQRVRVGRAAATRRGMATRGPLPATSRP